MKIERINTIQKVIKGVLTERFGSALARANSSKILSGRNDKPRVLIIVLL